MKVKDIISEMTSGSVATVSQPLFTERREAAPPPAKKKSSKKYRNSLGESAMSNIDIVRQDIEKYSDSQFKKMYGMTKDQAIQKYKLDRLIKEQDLQEDDLIVVPGTGRKIAGLIPHDADRTDHEVEMARSDLQQAAKNAKLVLDMISELSEEQGLEGWVQEKIIKAGDYLNTVREYLEGKYGEQEGSYGMGCGCSGKCNCMEGKTGPGLWANIHARRASGKPMRKKGQKGAPSEEALKSARAGSKK